MPIKDLLHAIAIGQREEALFTTLANRLTRLDKQMSDKDKEVFLEKSGKPMSRVVKDLLHAFDPDVLEDIEQRIKTEKQGDAPVEIDAAIQSEIEQLQHDAARVFTGDVNTFIEDVRKALDQIVDTINIDEITHVGWDSDNKDNANSIITEFADWMQAHKDELTALQIFYNQPFRRRDLTLDMIKQVSGKLLQDKPRLAPLSVWRAYETLGQVNGSPRNELIALVSLIRKTCGLDAVLTPYDKTVDLNFQDWVFQKQAGPLKFNKEQMDWLRMIKDYVAASFHIDKDDFELTPFNAHGGLGKMWQLFGQHTDEIIVEMNEALAA